MGLPKKRTSSMRRNRRRAANFKLKPANVTKCPKCKAAAKRVINGGMGVIFKGSGFYTTDYKKSSALTGGKPPLFAGEVALVTGAASGLGTMIFDAAEYHRSDIIISGCLIIGTIAIIMDRWLGT